MTTATFLKMYLPITVIMKAKLSTKFQKIEKQMESFQTIAVMNFYQDRFSDIRIKLGKLIKHILTILKMLGQMKYFILT